MPFSVATAPFSLTDNAVTSAKIISVAQGVGGYWQDFQGATVTAGTWVKSYSADKFTNIDNDTAKALNDEITMPVWLPKGTYTLDVYTRKNSTAPIITCYLDATSLGSFDLYNAGGEVQNSVQTIAGIVVATAGLYTFKYKVTSKNGASSNYRTQPSAIRWTKTA